MKAIIFSLIAALSFCAHAAEYWTPHWQSRLATIGFNADLLGPGKVLIIGDSDSEAFYWNAIDSCYAVNAGLGGARIRQIAEYAPSIAAKVRPKIVHIMASANNVNMDHSSPEWATMQADLLTAVNAFIGVGARVVMWPVFPLGPAFSVQDRAAINSIIATVSNLTGSYWDWWFPTQYEDANGYALPTALDVDQIHMSASSQTARYYRMNAWHDYIKSQTGINCN